MTGLYILNLACAWFMAGLIWTIQLVHYPLFSHADPARFTGFHARHSARITWIAAPVMCIELAAAALLAWRAPLDAPVWLAWTCLALAAIIWASTFLLQVPAHGRLREGFHSETHRRLVLTNWIRTAAWSARALLLLWPLPSAG